MFSRIVFAVLFAICGIAFADTIYLISDDKIENASLIEITSAEIKYKIDGKDIVYTISKNDAVKIVYEDGSEDVFKQDYLEKNADTNTTSTKDTSRYALSVGYSVLGFNAFFSTFFTTYLDDESGRISFVPGIGLVENDLIAVSFDLQLAFLLPSIPSSAITVGLNPRISLLENHEIITYIGFIYKQWLFNLGYSIGPYGNNNLSLNAGYIFESIKEKKIEKDKPAGNNEKPKESDSRYFRLGIELNYPVYRSEIEIFDNSFPYSAGGAGLFFRIGPEFFYLTTGAYAKLDILYKEGIVSKDFEIFGINIVSVPLLDLEWSRLFVEVPLLLSFGSGQIKFTGGALFDFYAISQINVNVNDEFPIIGGQNIISANDAEKIEERFKDIPGGNLYGVFGLDVDVVKHWGIGVKCLVWINSFGGSSSDNYTIYNINKGIEPSRFQTRISTYFVF